MRRIFNPQLASGQHFYGGLRIYDAGLPSHLRFPGPNRPIRSLLAPFGGISPRLYAHPPSSSGTFYPRFRYGPGDLQEAFKRAVSDAPRSNAPTPQNAQNWPQRGGGGADLMGMGLRNSFWIHPHSFHSLLYRFGNCLWGGSGPDFSHLGPPLQAKANGIGDNRK